MLRLSPRAESLPPRALPRPPSLHCTHPHTNANQQAATHASFAHTTHQRRCLVVAITNHQAATHAPLPTCQDEGSGLVGCPQLPKDMIPGLLTNQRRDERQEASRIDGTRAGRPGRRAAAARGGRPGLLLVHLHQLGAHLADADPGGLLLRGSGGGARGRHGAGLGGGARGRRQARAGTTAGACAASAALPR